MSKAGTDVTIKTNGSDEIPLGDDLLRGAQKIANFIGETERRARYLAECGAIPVGKERGSLIASKRKLRAHYDQLTG